LILAPSTLVRSLARPAAPDLDASATIHAFRSAAALLARAGVVYLAVVLIRDDAQTLGFVPVVEPGLGMPSV
jgi:hypothetical protein